MVKGGRRRRKGRRVGKGGRGEEVVGWKRLCRDIGEVRWVGVQGERGEEVVGCKGRF